MLEPAVRDAGCAPHRLGQRTQSVAKRARRPRPQRSSGSSGFVHPRRSSSSARFAIRSSASWESANVLSQRTSSAISASTMAASASCWSGGRRRACSIALSRSALIRGLRSIMVPSIRWLEVGQTTGRHTALARVQWSTAGSMSFRGPDHAVRPACPHRWLAAWTRLRSSSK